MKYWPSWSYVTPSPCRVAAAKVIAVIMLTVLPSERNVDRNISRPRRDNDKLLKDRNLLLRLSVISDLYDLIWSVALNL
jgi:hypothetical protein